MVWTVESTFLRFRAAHAHFFSAYLRINDSRERGDNRQEGLRGRQSLISIYRNAPGGAPRATAPLPAFRFVSLIAYSGNRYYITRRDIIECAMYIVAIYTYIVCIHILYIYTYFIYISMNEGRFAGIGIFEAFHVSARPRQA